MTPEEYQRRQAEACPSGPDEPCTFTQPLHVHGSSGPDGKCVCYPGHQMGCTCDIDWEELHNLAEEARG